MSNEKNMMDTINDRSALAEELRMRQETAALLAEENRKKLQREKQIRVRKRATKEVILRGVVTVLACVLLWICMGFGLVAQPLGFLCMALALAVQTFYIGAWMQFIHAKGGFLNVTE